MKIYSVFDPEYRPYGKVLEDYDTLELTAAMQKIPMPGAGVSYEASIPALEGLPVFRELSDRGFGGMPQAIINAFTYAWACAGAITRA